MAKIRRLKRVGQQELFGGSWTQRKLQKLQKYLVAYSRIFKRNPAARFFKITYVDAFAGTGAIAAEDVEMPIAEFSPELAELQKKCAADAVEYAKGSAVRALEVEPGFDQYLFIECKRALASELEARLRQSFPARAAQIKVVNEDANTYLTRWCDEVDWKTNRAVVFLDPCRTEVSWDLIEKLALTGAVDLWLLFPLYATNRMLSRKAKPPESWGRRLTRIFGTKDWESKFYRTEESPLLEGYTITERVADIDKIGAFFVERLRSIFPAVAEPLVLRNSVESPLFLLCFAAANKKGAPVAVKIAQDIIGRE